LSHTLHSLPYHLIDGIPYDTLYRKALACYEMLSAGLRDIITEKHMGRYEADYPPPHVWDELCFTAEAIILYHLILDTAPQQFTLTDGATTDHEAQNLFDEIVGQAFVQAWEDELAAMDEADGLPPTVELKQQKAFDPGFPVELLSSLSPESIEFLQTSYNFEQDIWCSVTHQRKFLAQPCPPSSPRPPTQAY